MGATSRRAPSQDQTRRVFPLQRQGLRSRRARDTGKAKEELSLGRRLRNAPYETSTIPECPQRPTPAAWPRVLLSRCRLGPGDTRSKGTECPTAMYRLPARCLRSMKDYKGAGSRAQGFKFRAQWLRASRRLPRTLRRLIKIYRGESPLHSLGRQGKTRLPEEWPNSQTTKRASFP